MPDYDYICTNFHEENITERMFYSTAHICVACGFEAWRKPQAINVTWGGLKPSQGEIAPAIAEHISRSDENRERVEEEVIQNKYRKEQEGHEPAYT